MRSSLWDAKRHPGPTVSQYFTNIIIIIRYNDPNKVGVTQYGYFNADFGYLKSRGPVTDI